MDGMDKKYLKSSQNAKKKESLKTKTSSTHDDWNTDEWGPEFSSSKSSKKPKDPLVGNLLDLDINDMSSNFNEPAKNDGWDNEVWADVDDDEWQSLELEPSSKRK